MGISHESPQTIQFHQRIILWKSKHITRLVWLWTKGLDYQCNWPNQWHSKGHTREMSVQILGISTCVTLRQNWYSPWKEVLSFVSGDGNQLLSYMSNGLNLVYTSAKRRGCNGHRFLCHPYRSWEFHDGIKYQCPGVAVPKCRRFWRALIYWQHISDNPS